jgi:two-component system, OmpR family, sensor histidine kinase KdpD
MLFSYTTRQTPIGAVVETIGIQNSNLRRLRQVASQVLVGALLLSILTFVAYQFHFSVAATSAVFLLVVVLQSVGGDFAASAVVCFIAFAVLDYFFTEPLFSFAITDPLDVLDLIAFFVVALVITRLVSRLRVEVKAARTERGRTERLFRLAQELLTLDPRTAVDAACLEPFRRVFDMRAVCLFDKETGEFHSVGDSRFDLKTRTRAAYFMDKSADDHITWVSTRCLRVADKTLGAIGFEDLDDPGLTATPLATLAATFMERIHAFRSAGEAVATAQSEAYRSAILDALAHEFKTPLATILAAAGGIHEAGPLRPEQAEMTETVETEAARLGQLTSRLLRMARLDREEVKPHMEWIDTVSLAEQVVRRYAKLKTGRGISVLKGCDCAETVADPELMRLAISQLLDNACKYSDLGSTVTLSIDRHDGVIAIRVSNTGSSIPSIERHRVFERYYRGNQARNVASGSGLGLYVARKIALAHGGSLELEDRTAASGTTFRLTVPVSKIEEHEHELRAAT